MTPEQALAALTRAAVSMQQLPVGPARQCNRIVAEALQKEEAPDMSSQVEALKAELTDATLRIAELEEELAEASKPKRRGRKPATKE